MGLPIKKVQFLGLVQKLMMILAQNFRYVMLMRMFSISWTLNVDTHNLGEERNVGMTNYELSILGKRNLNSASRKVVLNR